MGKPVLKKVLPKPLPKTFNILDSNCRELTLKFLRIFSQTADKPHGVVSRKVFARLFQKAAPSKARSLGRRRNGEISLRRLLFAKLFLCACAAKEKADYPLSIDNKLLNLSFVINLSENSSKFQPAVRFCIETVLNLRQIAHLNLSFILTVYNGEP